MNHIAILGIDGTENTPQVGFNTYSQTLFIFGRSIPLYGVTFYEKIQNWLGNYMLSNPRYLQFDLMLTSFNCATAKCLMSIFRLLQSYNKNTDTEIVINWYYEIGDEDSKEAGYDFKDLIKSDIQFNILPLNDTSDFKNMLNINLN